MSIEADLKTQLITAMKAKDSPTANVIKMIRSKITEKRTSKGFTGDITDVHCVEIVAAYKKSLEKARVEFVKAGEKGVNSVAELDHDIDFCKQFLPQPMGEDEVRKAVKEAIGNMGDVNAKMSGRVVGMVMKSHKGVAEASLVKRIVDEELS